MFRSKMLSMWAVKLAGQSFKQRQASAACISPALNKNWNGGESRLPVLSSLVGIGSFGAFLLGGCVWGSTALCEEEKGAAAGQKKGSSGAAADALAIDPMISLLLRSRLDDC